MERETLIQKRNQLLLLLLWSFYILDTFVYIIIESSFKLFWPPVGFVICLILSILMKRKVRPLNLMIFNIIGVYIFLFYVNFSYPYLVNYLFFILGIIISAFYQSYLAMILSTILAVSCLLFFSLTKGEIILGSSMEDYPYVILLALLISILLIYMIKYANRLWTKAYQNELKAKEDLSSTKSIVEAFFRNTKDAIAVVDLDLRIVEINESFKTLMNDDSNMAGEHISNFIIDSNGVFNVLLNKAKNGDGVTGAEVPIETSTGSHFILEVTISPVFNQENQIFAVSLIIRDVTEKKMLEEYVRNSEKLKITGEMAAGVAHEIRNPLTVISGFIQMISEKDDANKQYFSIIHNEITRMNAIISEFLVLSKPQSYSPKPHKLQEIIQEVILLYESEAHYKNIAIIQQCEQADDFVFCDINQLKQVFINLLKNAFEALPSGGKISFNCYNRSTEELTVTIQDDGIGIPSEVLTKLGKPFFTTKENGTGLGLMITQQIIKRHNGKMNIMSKEQIGTTVEMILPIYKP